MSNPLVRNIIAIIAGFTAAIVTVGLAEATGHLMFPPPEGLDMTDPADQAKLMELIPLGAKIAVVIAWFLGAAAGAWVAMRISGSVVFGWAIGLILVALSVWTTQVFPHPAWMMVAAVVLPLAGVIAAKQLAGAYITPK